MIYSVNERPQGTGELTLKSSRGVCLGCGDVVNTELYVHISDRDAEAFSRLQSALSAADLSELNQALCSCGSTLRSAHPLTVHLSGEGRLLVFVPEAQRMWAHEVCSLQLFALSARSHIQARPYFTQAELCVGPSALSAALGGAVSAQLTPSHSLKAPSITPASELMGEIDPLDELLDEALDQENTGIYDMNEGRPAPVQVSQQLSALDSLNPSTMPPLVPETDSGQTELSLTAVNLLEGGPPTKAGEGGKEGVTRVDVDLRDSTSDDNLDEAFDGPTDLSRKSVIASILNDEDNTSIQGIPDALDAPASSPTELSEQASSTQLLYSNSMRLFDREAAGQGNSYLKLTDETIEAAALLDERQAEGWLMCDLDVRAQLHFVEGGAAPCLTLFSVQNDSIEDELYWPIEVDGSMGPKILRALRKSFRFELTLYKKNGHHYGQRVVEAPLEENVGYILSAIKRLQMTPRQAARALFEVRNEEYDRNGRMNHSFAKDSYTEISSAADAKLAAGIWAYWSTVKQRDYLLLIKSFPLSWLRRIQHRILKAGLDYGVAMPPHLQSQAVALRLAKSDVELLQRLVANFAEVSLKLKNSQLSAEDEWENWDLLLTQVEELGIPVDEDIEQLAFQAMERAGLSGESLFGDEVASPEDSFDSVDDVGIEELSAVSEPEWISDELIEEDLIDGELLDIELLDEDLIEAEELIEAGELLEADELIEGDLELLEDSMDGET